jgi:hypothetical protein
MNSHKPARTRPATTSEIVKEPTRASSRMAGHEWVHRLVGFVGICVEPAIVLDAANDFRPRKSEKIGDYGVAARVVVTLAMDGSDLGSTVHLMRDDGRTHRTVEFKTRAEAVEYAHKTVQKRYRLPSGGK